jgi:hypothetical protein
MNQQMHGTNTKMRHLFINPKTRYFLLEKQLHARTKHFTYVHMIFPATRFADRPPLSGNDIDTYIF